MRLTAESDPILVRAWPELNALNEFFWTAGIDGVLRIQQCDECSQFVHPPSPRCPNCLGSRLFPSAVSGRGVVHSFTVNMQPWVPEQDPYIIGLVSLVDDERVRLTTNLLQCRPDEVRIGMPVQIAFVPWNDLALPCFVPEKPELPLEHAGETTPMRGARRSSADSYNKT